MNEYLINRQCYYLKQAILLCNDENEYRKYEQNINNSLIKHKNTFKKWCELYKLPLNYQ